MSSDPDVEQEDISPNDGTELEKKVKNSKSWPLFTDDVMVLVRGRGCIYGVTPMFCTRV
jgi:hypothetical protein